MWIAKNKSIIAELKPHEETSTLPVLMPRSRPSTWNTKTSGGGCGRTSAVCAVCTMSVVTTNQGWPVIVKKIPDYHIDSLQRDDVKCCNCAGCGVILVSNDHATYFLRHPKQLDKWFRHHADKDDSTVGHRPPQFLFSHWRGRPYCSVCYKWIAAQYWICQPTRYADRPKLWNNSRVQRKGMGG